MDWPAKSPDLNPIEHVWDALGRVIATRNPPLRTIQEMKTALLNEWNQLIQEMINCLISSMKSRCKACISKSPKLFEDGRTENVRFRLADVSKSPWPLRASALFLVKPNCAKPGVVPT
ncbi:hypothetical protein AVEN_196350-1 [Araneus ventricosus]|uniref:Tc1-like transposase DDE domain-containing protein n=1 Tax=Araneus ventricosus TaxID=182803 RepID=A0A4Y2AW52_ARAVE|nr:hypothetical protein AVEN_196350-1 [Araneus ventricosus]